MAHIPAERGFFMRVHVTALTVGLLLVATTVAGCVPCPSGPCVRRTSEVPESSAPKTLSAMPAVTYLDELARKSETVE
jgi:hypothetical protein